MRNQGAEAPRSPHYDRNKSFFPTSTTKLPASASRPRIIGKRMPVAPGDGDADALPHRPQADQRLDHRPQFAAAAGVGDVDHAQHRRLDNCNPFGPTAVQRQPQTGRQPAVHFH